MANTLAGTFSVDGNSAEFVTTGGEIFVSVRGTFGAGTVTLQHQLTDATWVAIDGAIMATFTADGDKVATLPPGITMRLNLAGATAPDIDYIAQRQ